MAVVRAFIALELPPPLLSKLSLTTEDLQARLHGLPLRWSPPAKLHLTLKFLGDVGDESLQFITAFMNAQASHTRVFEFTVGGFGTFPNAARPRVLWVGVRAPDELAGLQRRLEQEAARLGIPEEGRPFAPHLTLARVGKNASAQESRRISEIVRDYEVPSLGVAQVSGVHLFKSDLRPGGSVYTCLHSAPFGPPAS
ncbi:MAG: RNA 2',3'-cyclic phosphodiesterase [Anaerolineae bacterium]|nr:MAG: RNA 2',3'-cyclic phosphodiesterase [Anaerolineae bacterium]